MRLHPAASRVAKLAKETPASFVAFDLLAVDGRDVRDAAAARAPRAARARCSPASRRPLHLTPMTRDRADRRGLARALRRRRARRRHREARRRRLSARQARDDQDQARAHRRLRRRRLPLAQDRGRTPSARCCSACTTTTAGCSTSASRRRSRWRCGSELVARARAAARARARRSSVARVGRRRWREHRRACPAAQSRWSAGKDLSWEPLRIERVCEVKYDHLQGDRFRHAAVFLRWRPGQAAARTAATISSRSRRLTSSAKVFGALDSRARFDRAPSRPTSARFGGSSSGSSGSCAGRSSSGTCCRLTRMRVQV